MTLEFLNEQLSLVFYFEVSQSQYNYGLILAEIRLYGDINWGFRYYLL